MPEVEVNDMGSIGVVTDQKPYMIPPEAWTVGTNMRVVDDDLEKMLGWAQTFGTPPITPHFAMSVRTTSASFWLYVSLTKAGAFDGITHSDVTRISGDYTASATRDWNGTTLGGIPILNNGADVPQFWAPISVLQRLQNLTNWPGTMRARVIRAFGPYLMALHITDSGNSFPHRIRWSDAADPGTLPGSWDIADPTVDAGEVDLPDVDAGILLDMLPLSETMYIYKESSIWKCRYVGGRFIFDFGKGAWLTTTGILAPRCVTVTGDGTRQVWASQDDILWHDGNRVRSLLNSRRRRELFNALDPQNYINSFMFTNPFMGEVWFCFVPTGQVQPTRALVFNYLRGGDQWPVTDVDGVTFRNASAGPIEQASNEAWDAGSNTWDVNDGPWAELERRRVILCGTDAAKFYDLDRGPTRDGLEFTGVLQRVGLSVLGKKRSGEWITNWDRMKLWDRIWPRVSNGPVTMRVGQQTLIDGPVTWNSYVDYDPQSNIKADLGPVSGRGLAIEVRGTSQWRLSGYKTDVRDLGMF